MIEKDCKNKTNHTKGPSGYLEWHDWALAKSRRHKNVKCPDCGLYAIWVKREKDEPDYGGDEWMIEAARSENHTV